MEAVPCGDFHFMVAHEGLLSLQRTLPNLRKSVLGVIGWKKSYGFMHHKQVKGGNMRLQPFLETLRSNLYLDRQKTEYFMNTGNFQGGWEVWLQCEIGFAFNGVNPNNVLLREVPYPSGDNIQRFLAYRAGAHPPAWQVAVANQAARADFQISRMQGPPDTTFLELKCRLQQETHLQTWNRLENDVEKIRALSALNNTLNCIALLATFGTFTQQDIQALNWFYTGGRNARVLDYSQAQNMPIHTELRNVALNGNPRTFIVGVS